MNCSWGYKTDGMVTIGMPFDRRFYLIRPDLGLNRNNLSKEDFIVTQDVALAIKLEKPDNVAIGSNTDDDVDAVISSVVFFLSLVFFSLSSSFPSCPFASVIFVTDNHPFHALT